MKISELTTTSDQLKNPRLYLFLGLVCTLIAAMTWGHYGQFIPHSDYASALATTSLLCSSILFSMFIWDEYCSRRRAFRKIIQLERPLELYTLAIIGSVSLPYLLLCFFLPAGLHLVTATPGQITFTVTRKEHKYIEHKQRDGKLEIDSSFMFANNIYMPTKARWDRVNVGDTVTLVGKVSPFGVSYSEIRISEAASGAK